MEQQVKDHENLVRDGATGAILSKKEGYLAYKRKQAQKLKERDKERQIEGLKNDVKELRSLMGEVLSALQELKSKNT